MIQSELVHPFAGAIVGTVVVIVLVVIIILCAGHERAKRRVSQSSLPEDYYDLSEQGEYRPTNRLG
jgi:hypothetical protein